MSDAHAAPCVLLSRSDLAATSMLPDVEWGHRVHAIVQPVDPANPPTPEALCAFCKAQLAAYEAPRTFEFVAALSRTPTGKLNRTALGPARGQREQ